MEEKWKPIMGYEQEYLISSFGRVKSLYRNRIRGIGKDKRGYTKVVLYKDGTRVFKLIHRLVAIHFIDNPNNYPCVDHIDTNPENNRVDNLRWASHSMNARNPLTYQKMFNRQISVNLKNNKINSKRIVRISNDGAVKEYPSQSEAMREGFSQSKISECCKGLRKTHKGYNWMFKDDFISSNTNNVKEL